MTLPRPHLALVALLAILWAAMMLLGGPRSGADATVADLFRLPGLAPAASVVTRLGDWPILLPLTALGGLALFRLRDGRHALLFLGIVFSARILVEAQKMAFARARPELSGRLVHVSSLSFPSAHAAYSMVTWLSLALLLASPRARPFAAAAAVAVALLVGLSRLVLHVHWGSDVIGGWAFGAGWTLAALRLAARAAPAARD
jgi:undecaprenyl-diphosphatase